MSRTYIVSPYAFGSMEPFEGRRPGANGSGRGNDNSRLGSFVVVVAKTAGTG